MCDVVTNSPREGLVFITLIVEFSGIITVISSSFLPPGVNLTSNSPVSSSLVSMRIGMSTLLRSGVSYSTRLNKPSDGMNDKVPGDLDQRDRRTQGWKQGVEIAFAGLSARVTSGVSERREVHSTTPDKTAEICFDLLLSEWGFKIGGGTRIM